MNVQAVIFDLDGVLIDSEFYWIQAEMEFLKKYGITLDKKLTAQMTGRSLHESVVLLKKQFDLSEPVEELLGEKIKVSDSVYYQAAAMPGVIQLLKAVKAKGMKCAIASGATLKRIKLIVERFRWETYFNELVSTDHVNLVGKPDPAIYRYAAERLGVVPSACVALEDSVNGVRSAQGAGMRCVAIPDPRWSHGDFSLADATVTSLTDKRLYDFLGLDKMQ